MTDARGRMLILTGPPGSGKSTVARLVAARFERAVHLQADKFFHFILSGSIEPWKPESHGQNEVVNRIVEEAATRYAEAGYFTIVDGIFFPWFYERFRGRLWQAEFEVTTVILRPSLAVCTSRVGHRDSSHLADPSVIQQLWNQFSDLGQLERHVIDNSSQDATMTADAVIARL